MPSTPDRGPFPARQDCPHHRLLQVLLDSIPSQVYVLDLEGRILLANRAMEELSGAPPGGLDGRFRDSLLSEEEAEQRRRADHTALTGGRPAYSIDTLRAASGGEKQFLAVRVPWQDETGAIRGIAGISTDITKLQATEQRLRVSESAHRHLFEKNPQPMWVYDVETLQFLAVNEAAIRQYGYSREEFLSMTIADIRPPEDLPRLQADIASTDLELNYAGEWRHLTRCGEVIDVEIRSHSLDWAGRPARLVVSFDITARKRATEELDRFFTLSQDLLCIATKDGRFLRLNPQWSKTFGYPLEEMLGRNFAEFNHPDDVSGALEAAQAMSDDAELRDYTNRFRCRDGSYRTLEWHAHALGDTIYSVARDITEKRKAEERLRELSRAIEQSPASVLITDLDGSIEYVNPKFESLTGYSMEEVRGLNPRILQSGRTNPKLYEQLWETIMKGEVWEGELENRRKDGSFYNERVSISPVRDEKGEVRHFVAVKEDITEERRLQAQLIQAQKMEAIGLFAGGIAHDFNNLLTIINGYTELALGHPDVSEPLRRQLSTILTAGEQAAGMTRQLLLFGRKQPGAPVLIELNPLVADLGDFYRRVLPENIRLAIFPSQTPAFAVADPTLLQQVVMNLVLNARDAMPQGGQLRVRIEQVRVAPDSSEHRPDAGVPAGPYVLLEIGDTGVGMSEEVLEHVFEPFYSTKPQGQGTGLGLATVFGIVKSAGGGIHVESAPGKGTRFRVYLPDAGDPAEHYAEADVRPATHTGQETILLIEDSEDVRRFALEALKSLGYSVLAASSGEEAVAVAERHTGVIDVIVTDVMLPGLNGPEAVEIIRQITPGVGVLYASGYVSGDPGIAPLQRPGVHFIPKPFTLAALGAAVREALSRRSRSARILVVDDDEAIRELLSTVLTEAGYQVATAKNGDEALAQVQRGVVDLMLLDLVMPDREGLETLAAIRRNGHAARVIAISGAFGGQFLRTAQMLGAQATLLKPISRSQLLETVAEVLRQPLRQPSHSA
jgi:two-component system, cell cycle sensor histidine kinase and response regulator CckA